MKNSLVLFGAGTTGRVIARDLNAKGTPALCFVDNDTSKWGMIMENTHVLDPQRAAMKFPDATWICSVVRPERHEIIAQMLRMDVKIAPMWDYLPKRYNLPPESALMTVRLLIHDKESVDFWNDQLAFRAHPESYTQIPQANIDHIYFEDFITKRDDEVFWDAGAADADTVLDFISHRKNYKQILAIEPDVENFAKLRETVKPFADIFTVCSAVGDYNGCIPFVSHGDYSSHVELFDSSGIHKQTSLWTLDDIRTGASWLKDALPPTFIKFDIEGFEPNALWGARNILDEYRPVLAVCAYHTAEHLWTLPLLIHALQPGYSLFFRRYAESTFEIVWYAVPPERIAL